MYFDLALLSCVLALLHVTLFFFMGGHKRLELVTNGFAFLGLLFSVGQYVALYKMPTPPYASFSGILLLLTIALFISYFAMYIKYKRPSIGLFVFPLTVLFVLISRFSSNIEMSHEGVVVTIWLYIHLPFTIMGGTAFFLCFRHSQGG